MKNSAYILILLLSSCSVRNQEKDADEDVHIKIKVNHVQSVVSKDKLGLNLNFWFDSDKYFKRDRILSEALKEYGAGVLRYPGGSKSGKDLWSIPPFDNPQPTVARIGDAGWPWDNAPTVFNADGSYVNNKMDFDEFMQVCKTVNAQPTIVINCQAHKNPAHASRVTSLDQLILTAREWVRYANIVKGHAIKYWEIGNEVCLDNHCGEGAKMTAEEYADVLIRFSKAMKAVDPSIKIGAWRSWSDDWMETVIKKALDHFDFLVVHTYYSPKGYADYSNKPFQETPALRYIYETNKRIERLPEGYKEKISIAVTEFGARDFSGKDWEERNDLGHALVNFEMQGKILLLNRVDFAAFWNTRWFGFDDYACAAFTEKENELTAIGKALSIWGRYIKSEMVEANSNHFTIMPFATRGKDGSLNLLILNKSDRPERASLDFEGLVIEQSKQTVFRGKGIDDLKPQFVFDKQATGRSSAEKVELPPYSVTIIELNQK